MKMGLLTKNPRAWCSHRLIEAMKKEGITPVCFHFKDLMARVALPPSIMWNNKDLLTSLKALLIRPIGRGSLDEIIFRLDLLRNIEKGGVPVINPPMSIEKAVNKYYALSILQDSGIPVPRTIVTENPKNALHAFYELGGDVIVKPIFGSRGIGITRVSDAEIANRIFKSLAFVHHVLYIQEFIPHGTEDIRAFVIGNDVIAAMSRIAEGWKTNVSQGARTRALSLSGELKSLAVKATKTLGCEIAGVDILKGPNKYYINEVNSQPGFQALQTTTQTNVARKIIQHIHNTFITR